ncbi:MAG: ATP-binding cassette domain-containing protein [Anaerolineales bacterium]
MEAVISVRGLTKKFGEFTAVDNISFDVHRGEIYGFLGPNGSGKTTTIRMILGLLAPTSGEVSVLGNSMDQAGRELRSRLGYMSQKFSLYNDLTVIQNLRFYGAAYGLGQEELDRRIVETLDLAGLTGRENTKTRELSGGWRQRLALGVSFLHRPEIIILDEPTAGVDPASRRIFWGVLYDLVKSGVTIFVTTHYMDEAEHCHRLGFILDGEIIVSGTPSEIKNKSFGANVIEIYTSDQNEAVKILRRDFLHPNAPEETVEIYGSSIHVVSRQPQMERDIRRLLQNNGLKIHHSAMIAPSLEDVFIASVRKNGTNRQELT